MIKKILLTLILITLVSACRTSVDVRGGTNNSTVAVNVKDSQNRTMARVYTPAYARIPSGFSLLYNFMTMLVLR